MKRLICLFVLLFAIGGQVMAAGPAPCYFQSLWTQCGTPNVRVGTNAASFGAIINPTQTQDGAGFYLDNAGSAAGLMASGSSSQTGYTQVVTQRVTTNSGIAFGVYTNYQDSQSQGTALTVTNEKSALLIRGDGTMTMPQGTIGVTNGSSACTGCVGEELIQSRLRTSSTSLTTNISANMLATALTLTNGDWDLSGGCGFQATNAATALTAVVCGVSVTSATQPADSTYTVANSSGEVKVIDIRASATNVDLSVLLPVHRVSITGGSVTFYLVQTATFSNTASGYGFIRARRMR